MGSSSDRKFDSGRLYKLVKRIVIAVAVLAGLWFMLSIYIYNFELGEIYSRNRSYCGDIPLGESEIALEYYGSCVKNADSVEKFWVNSLMFSPLVVFGLPIIFFGGIGIYKYLFPKAEVRHEGASKK